MKTIFAILLSVGMLAIWTWIWTWFWYWYFDYHTYYYTGKYETVPFKHSIDIHETITIPEYFFYPNKNVKGIAEYYRRKNFC